MVVGSISFFLTKVSTFPKQYFQGVLVDKQQLIVKRLSKTFGKGIEEFKNEVMLIANV